MPRVSAASLSMVSLEPFVPGEMTGGAVRTLISLGEETTVSHGRKKELHGENDFKSQFPSGSCAYSGTLTHAVAGGLAHPRHGLPYQPL